MTDSPTQQLVTRVLELDEAACGKPWYIYLHGNKGTPSIGSQHGAVLDSVYRVCDQELITDYRTSTPKLARIVERMVEALKHYAKGAPYIGFDRGDIAADALKSCDEIARGGE